MKHFVFMIAALLTLTACGVDGEPSAPAPRASLTE
jgi:predicted small lipoprotein YifL